MNYQPILRNYQQMVRIVRDKGNSATSFKLGNAYGDNPGAKNDVFARNGVTPTELQIRTLNEMNLPSTSLRRPEKPAVDGFLATRAGSTLYHKLNDTSQDYFNGLGSGLDYIQAVGRSDAKPGTKLRTELGKGAVNKKVFTQVPFHLSANHLAQTSPGHTEKRTDKSQDNFNAFK
ncbi:hypothetical protein SG34_014890 [Thalassomonas viridans]|uniref:Uncharacterized protein n=1 Tax=Thalassomonas viridans TaxID=137584 RepID=A0AAE9Z794_9GAMM|nr:hypothetical protein [Thalassomonas viridans]WDE08065.1 hypothetical protein SG34_014890 [Thalassomonas viridans]